MRTNERIPWLNNPLEISLEPFTHNGKIYRVIGTQTLIGILTVPFHE